MPYSNHLNINDFIEQCVNTCTSNLDTCGTNLDTCKQYDVCTSNLDYCNDRDECTKNEDSCTNLDKCANCKQSEGGYTNACAAQHSDYYCWGHNCNHWGCSQSWSCDNSYYAYCSEHADYSNTYNYKDSTVYDNHVNYTDTATYKDYNEYTNTYTYANHTDYNNYANQSIDYPHGFTLDIAEAGPDNWTTLTSSIPDIKKLREEIKRITDKYGTRKAISAEGALGASVGPIEWETLVSDNRDAEFGANKYARAAQINETINNVEKLWQAMRADASGLPALKNRGDRMRKQDYKTIIRKAQTLAQMEQPPEAGYLNHLDGNLFTKITPSKVYQQPAKVNENPTKVNENPAKPVKATLVAEDEKTNYILSRTKSENNSTKYNEP